MAGHSTKYPFPTIVFQALAAYDSPVSRAWECLFGVVGTVVYLCLLVCLVWVGPCQRLRVCIQSLALPRGAGQTYDAPSQPFPVMTPVPVLAAHKLVRVCACLLYWKWPGLSEDHQLVYASRVCDILGVQYS